MSDPGRRFPPVFLFPPVSCCFAGIAPSPSLPPEDIPTASFGILSIGPYRRYLETINKQEQEEEERKPVVVEHATLNLLTMQPDERYNTREEYEAALGVIRDLVPYFTREYLAAYVARFCSVPHTVGDGSRAWNFCDARSSTSVFVSRLRESPNHDGPNKFELIIKDVAGGGADIRLEDRRGNHARLPHRPRSCNESGKLWPPMDYSLRECMYHDIGLVGAFVQYRATIRVRPCGHLYLWVMFFSCVSSLDMRPAVPNHVPIGRPLQVASASKCSWTPQR